MKIFITSDIEDEKGYYKLLINYYNVIIDSGGIPFTTCCNDSLIDYILENADGLLFTGGLDIDSKLYNEEPHKENKTSLEIRDTFEMKLMRKALEMKKPILGICRGCQLLNVALGGKLNQHVENHLHLEDRTKISHKVILEDGIVKGICNVNEIDVNTVHHQVISDIGENLKVECYNEDRHIEGISYKNSFALGVQWHPEMLCNENNEHSKIFKEFIKQCKMSIL